MDSTSIITQVTRDEEPLSTFPAQEKGKKVNPFEKKNQQTWLPNLKMKINTQNRDPGIPFSHVRFGV